MLYSGSASAQHWEILRGVKDFYPIDSINSSSISKDSNKIYVASSDKVYIFTDRKWKYYDFRQNFLDCTSDTVLRKIISETELDLLTFDKNDNFWVSYAEFYTLNSGIILQKIGDTIKVFDKYYNIDTKSFEKFGKSSCIAFDNYNNPYIIADIDVPYNENQKLTYSNIFKIENDTMKLIGNHSVRHTAQFSQIVFDSKNNFWTFHYDSLFYYANDTLSKHFSCRYDSETMPSELLNYGHFKFIHIDSNDDLIAMHAKYILYSYKNNEWIVDTTVRQFVKTFYPNQMKGLEPNQVCVDSKYNLWIKPFGLRELCKRDINGNWTYHKIPQYTNHKKGGSIIQSIIPIDDTKVLLTGYNLDGNGLIYYTEEE